MANGYRVAVVGATGAVGTKMSEMLEQSTLPIASVKLLASSRSAGKKAVYNGQESGGGGCGRLRTCRWTR